MLLFALPELQSNAVVTLLVFPDKHKPESHHGTKHTDAKSLLSIFIAVLDKKTNAVILLQLVSSTADLSGRQWLYRKQGLLLMLPAALSCVSTHIHITNASGCPVQTAE